MNIRKLLDVLLVLSFLTAIAVIFNSASLFAGVIASAYILPFFVVLLMVYALLYVSNKAQYKLQTMPARNLHTKYTRKGQPKG
ncbi:hypothetical protein [Vibrio marisflavi]|uniref:Uncharacterized protein n=1 Tax=Vibrio marisflavi CECT 7928 TaxID=634439 RepID=A0ABN8E4L0_9VIBR|nr:hypothetical protein [Vibrio marisflavi]CAH0539463.1 hypothetical protein VMF7928_02167 [Vibrio marisflavi CECT 7928]